MKPRTKIQKAVALLQNRLFEITKEQEEECFEALIEKYCFKNKTKAHCLECTHEMSAEEVGRKKTIVCPECGSKLKVKETRGRTISTIGNYSATIQIVSDDTYSFQVVRFFELAKHCKIGCKPKYYFVEVCQNWHYDDKKRIIYSRLDNGHSWQGGMEVRNSTYWKSYKPYVKYFMKGSQFTDEQKKYGITREIKGRLFDCFDKARYTSQFETLLKAGYTNVFLDFGERDVRMHWDALKICIRNKYKIKDASMYLDYLGFLKEFKKDLKNKLFVCPKNLKKEHDKYLLLINKKRAKEQAERARIQAIKDAEMYAKDSQDYEKRIEPFKSLEIKGNKIKIVPLVSIEQFIEEAEEHKHCVLRSKYYEREDSLILRAIVEEKSVETIEVDLGKRVIVQSRGKFNQQSEKHDEIINLVNSQMHKIFECITNNN